MEARGEQKQRVLEEGKRRQSFNFRISFDPISSTLTTYLPVGPLRMQT
jgi:hypothetical protein